MQLIAIDETVKGKVAHFNAKGAIPRKHGITGKKLHHALG
jgi:hypothetical protein